MSTTLEPQQPPTLPPRCDILVSAPSIIRPQRAYNKRPIATGDLVAAVLCKKAERIEVLFLFWVKMLVDPSHTILDAGRHSPTARGVGCSKMLLILPYINTTVSTHSPESATFHSATAKLIYLLVVVVNADCRKPTETHTDRTKLTANVSNSRVSDTAKCHARLFAIKN